MACIRPVRTHNLIKELSSRLRRLRRKPKSVAGKIKHSFIFFSAAAFTIKTNMLMIITEKVLFWMLLDLHHFSIGCQDNTTVLINLVFYI